MKAFLASLMKMLGLSKEKPSEKKEDKKSPNTEPTPKVEDKPAEPVKETPKPQEPKIEDGFTLVDLNAAFLEEATKWVGVKEKGGNNKGPEVERFQKAVDGKAQAEAWCMAFMQFCVKEIEKRYNVKSKIARSEGCTDCYDRTPADMKMKSPKKGALVIWNYKGSWKGHTGVVRSFNDDRIYTIEGNTGDGEGVVRDGDGVFKRDRSRWGEGNMQIKGYILPFPEGLQKVKKV